MDVSAVNSVDKNAFLNLLATQLRYQNPMDPMDNTEFIAQLAQFSALETAENTRTDIQTMSGLVMTQYGTSLLGRHIEGVSSQTGQAFSGQVTGINMGNGNLQIQIGNLTVGLMEITQVE
jgi:flagellar basal-body rod modification protein FlgD